LIDRAFVFCPKEELQREVISSLQFILRILKILHFKFKFVLSSSRREKQKEKEALSQLEEALKTCGVSYTRGKTSSERSGPAIEVRIEDGMGQEWTGSFIEINCRPKSVKEEIISLSLFNSLERGIALLLENKGGEIPLWLAPVQVELLGVEEEAYAKEVFAFLQKAGVRVELDLRGEKLAKRMHEALRKKTPWLVLVGEREKNSKLISIRSCNSSETEEINVDGFIQKVMTKTQEELA
jgi:threonyl-tRNA synthetase